jgi:hypothetical protein
VSPQIYALKAFLITHADYLLFAAAVATKSLALCLAYTWNRNLDGKDETRDDVTPDENPGAAVVTLLDSGQADLAIGTNGKIWQLYSAKAHSRSTNHYEIDLEEIRALSSRTFLSILAQPLHQGV